MQRVRVHIDAIFLYQFVVYLAIWCWALYALATHESPRYVHLVTFVVAPPVVLAGYLIKHRLGITLCAAGDLAMSFAVGSYALALLESHGLNLFVVLAGSLSLCMLVRFLRDLLVMFGIGNAPS